MRLQNAKRSESYPACEANMPGERVGHEIEASGTYTEHVLHDHSSESWTAACT